MTVKVNGRAADTEHPKADTIHVQDGHLIVQHWIDNQNIAVDAIYAPGQWNYAEVDRKD